MATPTFRPDRYVFGRFCLNGGGTLLTRDGLKFPQSTYWPKVHGLRRGYLKEELDYFLKCVAAGRKPTAITPEESRAVVHAVLTAERSARENRLADASASVTLRLYRTGSIGVVSSIQRSARSG